MTSKTLDYHKTCPNLPWFVAEQLQLQMQTLWAVQEIRDHLEAQQKTPDMESALASIWAELDRKQDLPSVSQPTERPALSSSEAIEKEPEMKPTWSSSSLWSSRVKADGTLVLSVPPGTWDLCSSLVIRGNGPEEGITPILIRKASTPPAGSASLSTVEPTREASGVRGMDAGESKGWPHCKASGWVDSDEFNSLLVQCDQKPGHAGDHYDSSAGRAFSSRTMKGGNEEPSIFNRRFPA